MRSLLRLRFFSLKLRIQAQVVSRPGTLVAGYSSVPFLIVLEEDDLMVDTKEENSFVRMNLSGLMYRL